jgi:cardiolipin synthase
MALPETHPLMATATLSVRQLAEQAFSRAAGAPLIAGNSVRLLRDAAENYPAWMDAIQQARRYVHLESYIVHPDRTGWSFAQLLMEKARQGVRVRVLYDWLGARGHGWQWRRFRRALEAAGVEVRCFNPPEWTNPFGWLGRDHRKMLIVDGRIAFVSGLCVGDDWVGNPARGIEPWRDTGVAIRGPALAPLQAAFASTWALAGPPLPPEEQPGEEDLAPAGTVALRIVASEPETAGLYRLDQLVAALARRSIWLTDAYFVGTTPYVRALASAALDGVDVRLLVPRATDVPFVRSLSRTAYRPLLEAGVRIFEWNGPMLHAKTAVADGRWARVGSTNLNLASWIGNWELDVVVEDEEFAAEMEQMYLQDLSRSTEIVLLGRRRVRPLSADRRGADAVRARGSAGRAASGVVAITSTIGAVITRRRTLGPAEVRLMLTTGLLLMALAAAGLLWPPLVAVPFAVVAGWLGAGLILTAYGLWRRRLRLLGIDPPAEGARVRRKLVQRLRRRRETNRSLEQS